MTEHYEAPAAESAVADAAAPQEYRIKLTETQLRMLGETQARLAQARALQAESEREARNVISLVFDAHGLSPDAQAQLDEKTGELVYVA